MSKVTHADARQQSLAGLGEGSVVKLDGGKRLRLDDRVDYWPATQAWQTIDDSKGAASSGIGMPSMLAFLKQARANAGRPVAMPTPIPSKRPVKCQYCGNPAELHDGLSVYPDRKDLEGRKLWICWACDAWVGCHRGTDKPFGELANEEFRHARKAAHEAFDPIWKEERLSKSDAYAWLACELGVEPDRCQIGLMSLDECRQVRELVWERLKR